MLWYLYLELFAVDLEFMGRGCRVGYVVRMPWALLLTEVV